MAVMLVFVGMVALVSWINGDRDGDEVFDCRVLSIVDDPTVYGYGDVREAILDGGHVVGEEVNGPGAPFRVPARTMQVEGHDLRIYEYADEASRQCDSDTIGMGGWSVNVTPVEWIGTPHFWLRGRVIVLYLGDNAEFIGLVTDAVGPQLDVSGL